MLLLQLGWTMGTFWSWMVWPNRSMSIQLPPSCMGPGQPYVPLDISAYPRLQAAAGRGVLGSTFVRARFARAGSSRGRGAFSNVVFEMVFPLAGSRCVPRTGVRFGCPLGVALPAPLPCFSPLPHSGANCSSARTGALDWGKKVENAAAV